MTARIAIQDLINAYAHYADSREAQKQAELFTASTVVRVYNGTDPQPVQKLHGRKELAEAFSALRQYDVTTHFIGQSILHIDHDTASGETYCLAHHVKTADKSLMVMSIRYQDKFAKENGQWRFSERNLYIDWVDNRALQ